jgi:hypothetical protein
MTPSTDHKPPFWKRLSRFDGAVLGTLLTLFLLIVVVGLGGDRSALRVDDFSWMGKQVGVSDRYFVLRFNHRVDPATVAPNLILDPPLRGLISWQGKSLFYTLTEPPIYGINYQIKLENVLKKTNNQAIVPFLRVFSTRNRILAYIGLEGEEWGRLILKDITNINQPKKTILTPRDLIINQFEIYPDSRKILFSAFDPTHSQGGYSQQQLFTVSTGLNKALEPAGRIEPVLTAKDYQNQAFKLSADGTTIVLSRTHRNNPAESGLWVIANQNPPRPLGISGAEFIVSPDGSRAIFSQQGGVGVIPLTAEAGSFQFLPGFERGLGFTSDGLGMLLIKANLDSSRSLILLQANGTEKELFQTVAPIIDCVIEPKNPQLLYCLKINVKSQEKSQETGLNQAEPYISAVNLTTNTELPLLALPNYRGVQLSMSPDGIALLFDQVVTVPPTALNSLTDVNNQAIIDGRVWLLPLPNLEGSPERLKILPEELNPGFNPKWLP